MSRTIKSFAFAALAVTLLGVVAASVPQVFSASTPITESDATVNAPSVARQGQAVDATNWTVTAKYKKTSVSQP